MHVAVEKGAPIGQKFIQYVDYLETEHYIGKESRVWVDQIREKGNEATHEIPDISEEDAKDSVDFCSGLLKQIFEFPARARQKNQKPSAT